MPSAVVHTGAVVGATGFLNTCDTHIAASLPAFTIIGLPDAAIQSARDKVRGSIKHAGLTWPERRISTTLTPASLPRHGNAAEVAIAVSVLAAAGQIHRPQGTQAFLGGLDEYGRLTPIRGTLPLVSALAQDGITDVFLPTSNAPEAALVEGVTIHAFDTLRDLAAKLGADLPAPTTPSVATAPTATPAPVVAPDYVTVETFTAEAIVLAAAGGHHMCLLGNPSATAAGIGVLMQILPDMDPTTALEATTVASLRGENPTAILTRPPLAAPAYTDSAARILGGGSMLAQPGAVSAAHGGVLHLANAPEFSAHILQTLRQPLESGCIVLHRAAGAVRYPARFQLALTGHNCPCGAEPCSSCTPMTRRRYRGRLAGPLLDRVDLSMWIPPTNATTNLNVAATAGRVTQARELASTLLATTGATFATAHREWLLDSTPTRTLKVGTRAVELGALTARGLVRVLRVAWTIAALDGRERPTPADFATAEGMRSSA